MTKVQIANRWVDPDGKTHKGGDVVEVEPGVARDLIKRGKALPAPEKKQPPAKPAAAKPEATKPETPAKEAK